MMQNLQREAWYLGNLAGVPIFLHWSAFILVLLVLSSSAGGAERAILVLIALITGVLLHELGHGLMARALGGTGITITLWAFGGLCSSRRDSARLGREIAIVAAGPAVSLGLWLGCDQALRLLELHAPDLVLPGSLLAHGLAVGAWANQALFIFNMLPIFPMDGGQLVFYSALGLTRNQLLSRQIALFLAVLGAGAFFAWRTNLIDILTAGGTVGMWVEQLQFWDLFLVIILGMILRSAFAILYR